MELLSDVINTLYSKVSTMILTAEVTTVQVGFYSIEGLMDEKGTFYVGIPQVADLSETSRNTASRDFKRLMGKDFKTSKLKTSFNNKPILAVSLPDFEKLMFELALKGNANAINFMRSLTGLALHQLFCDAFNIKFEEEDRQEWLRLRQATKHDFRELTDELKKQGFTESWQYGKFVKQFQGLIGIDSGTRDEQVKEKLGELIKVQSLLIAYMDLGVKPFDAIKKLSSKINS